LRVWTILTWRRKDHLVLARRRGRRRHARRFQ
jgi:hypothetical protein